MEYTLLKEIVIERPILFLCGPYFDKDNKGDRRLILQNYLNEQYKRKYIPLVIDDFLTEENIQDKSISIQTMEEICAAISCKTYIFLDTMSASAELGIFANSAYMNYIDVFIPAVSDIYNKSNVGYFVRDAVLQKHSDRVNCLEYRPGIERKAIATDYVTEHYTFVQDKLPPNLAKRIAEDPILHETEKHCLYVQNEKDMPGTPYRIMYQKNKRVLEISISLKLLFYVTASIVLLRYADRLKQKRDSDFAKFDIDGITDSVRGCFKNYIEAEEKKDFSDCQVSLHTALQKKDRDLIYHIVKFVHVYFLYSRYGNYYLVKDPLKNILKKIPGGTHPNQIFVFDEEKRQLAEDINQKKDQYYERISIQKNRKRREIIKYRDDEYGEKARAFHKELIKGIEKFYTPCEVSYAYQKGKNIIDCVKNHKESISFLKYDVRKFFNSIKLDRLLKAFCQKLCIDPRFIGEIRTILETCFVDGELPLGLAASPILSDIYLHSFDMELKRTCDGMQLHYTRYADDLLISSKEVMDEGQFLKIDSLLKKRLRTLGLSINEEKSLRVNFGASANHIRYVGINIVYGEGGNYLSVGKTYIYETAKEYLKYREKRALLEQYKDVIEEAERQKIENDLFYERMILIGKMGFIRQVEGEEGLKRLQIRLKPHDIELAEQKMVI